MMPEERSPTPSFPDDPSSAARAETFEELYRIIATLRSPGGCPWDREQTHDSLRKYLLEESYETLEAIDRKDPAQLCDELGDVLLQIMLHSQIAAENGDFGIEDVIANLSAKMIRRHPHVFGEVSVTDSTEVVQNWEAIKAAERAGQPRRKSALDGIPREYPALMKAMEVSKRAVKVGFEWDRLEDVWAKVHEELAELETAAQTGSPEEIGDELGDFLFTLVNVARWLKVEPEESLRRMLDRFTARFQYMEDRLSEQGRSMVGVPLRELDSLWDDAKAHFRKPE